MVSLAAIAYYAFLFVGGIGFGYFVLRLTKPDTRLMHPTEKLGASAVYGFVLFAIAFALDYFVSGEGRFFEAIGFLPITLFFTILLSVFFLKLRNMLSKPQFLVVGVPAVKTPSAISDLDKSFALTTAQLAPAKTQAKAQVQPFKEITPSISIGMEDLASKPKQEQREEKLQQPTAVSKTFETPKAPMPMQPKPSATSGIKLEFEPRAQPTVRRKAGLKEFMEGIKHALGVSKPAVEAKEVEIAKIKEKATPAQIAEQVLERGQMRKKESVPFVGEDVEFKERELKKIKEAELEEIAKELVGETKGVEETGVLHRRYLMKKEEQTAAKQKEATPEEEFDSMVQEVYNQLQLSKTRAEVSDKLKLSPPPAEEKVEQKILEGQKREEGQMQAIATAPQQTTSLFAREANAVQPQASQFSSIFEQLNVISGGGASAKTEGDVKFVKIPANGAGCPRCHASNSRIVFCPYCGSGMCANCTPLITPKENGFDYTCPKCGESVFVKRQAQ